MKRSAGTSGARPAAVRTRTSTTPVVPGGEIATIVPADVTSKDFAGVEPNWTASAPVKLLPVIVTLVPPLPRRPSWR